MASGGTRPAALSLGAQVLRHPDRSASVEWLETNGRGDWACGTVGGVNTRREHGLFGATLDDGRRMTLLATLDATLEREGRRVDLASHQFTGARHPEGYRLCTLFASEPFPEWRCEFEGGTLTRRVFLPRGRRLAVCAWTLDAGSGTGWTLRVRPLFAYREAEALTRANPDCNMALRDEEEGCAMTPYPGCPEFRLRHPGGRRRYDPLWYNGFRHALDAAAGRPSDEDFFTPCEIAYPLTPGATVYLAAGLEAGGAPAEIEARERTRRGEARLPTPEPAPLAALPARSAESFVEEGRPGGARLILRRLGGEGGANREVWIALPGVLLHPRRTAEARALLAGALDRLARGGGVGDEALWFIRAAEQYVDHSRDWEFLRQALAPACEALAQRWIEGAPGVGYRLAPDGLLTSGGEGGLTWMDARDAGQAVTPRAGKPVEVNALWHHALGLLERWAARRNLPDKSRHYAALQELCGRSFRQRFWNAAEGCLYDVVDGPAGAPDGAIRPNQIWAVALPTDLLDRPQAAGTLAVVERRLMTPMGLRTLSIEDRAFAPSAAGDEFARARHQGAVHPWLMGAYVDAVFRVHGRTARGYARAEAALQTLLTDHLREGVFGHVAECFDGAAPHAPRGASASAAALGEILRACVETRAERW